MIYLKNIPSTQTIMIPRNGEDVEGTKYLVIKNTTDLQEKTLSVVSIATTDHYFKVSVNLPFDLADGEYQYRLLVRYDTLSYGVLYVGDLQKPTQHGTIITYKQYESE